MLLKIENGSVAFGADIVLSGIDFEINKGEKVALVGRNGSGKTTLLKVLVGEYELTRLSKGGESSVSRKRKASLGYLSQVTFEDETYTLLDEVKRAYRPLLDIEDKMARLLVEIERDPREEAVKAYSGLEERYRLLGGYSYQKEYETAIKRFGFAAEDKQKPLCAFSGGQRTKIAFIKLLLSKPDVLLLDEPTNHLDITAIEWLEEYLAAYPNAVVIVAHDREFLDKIVDSVYEIERGRIKKYTGNYSSFAEKKRLEWQNQLKQHIAQEKEIARLNDLVERFRYKATKAAMAQSKLKEIQRMEIVDAPEAADTKSFYGDFEPEYKSGQTVLTADSLSIGYDKPLTTLSLNIYREDKIGVIGGNGLGKSTFLKTLMGKVPPISGTYVFGDNVKIGYFDQQQALFESEKTVLDEYWDEFPGLTQTEVRSALGAFLFSGEDVYKPVKALSGGEKVRLQLCKILKQRPNFLILDEPTNHMDIIGKETLENMLKDYTGTLLFISHDRYFVRRIASSLLVFEEGEATYYPFGYEEYLEKQALKPAAEEMPPGGEKKTKKKFTTPGKEKAKREAKIKKLEDKLSACEENINAIKAEMESEEVLSDYLRLMELSEKLAEQEERNLEFLEEWDALLSEASEINESF